MGKFTKFIELFKAVFTDSTNSVQINSIVHKSCSTVTINGRNRTVEVFINGNAVYSGEVPTINIVGNITDITATNTEINVDGNVNSCSTTTGDIEVKGNSGECRTTTGDIKCGGSISGNCTTTTGDIKCTGNFKQVTSLFKNAKR